MTDNRSSSAVDKGANARHFRDYKARRKKEGFVQTTVFVHQHQQDAIDRAIARGEFPSRRAAYEHALGAMFGQAGKTANAAVT